MAGLVPAIHVVSEAAKTWMPATSAGMTAHGGQMSLDGGAALAFLTRS